MDPMPKAAPTYTTITFRRKFEDTPLLIEGGATAPLWFCGLLDGEFEVSFEPGEPHQWWISNAWLACHNGRTGNAAAGKLIELDAENRWFYLSILDSIDHAYGSTIPEWVADELALLDIGMPYERVA